jgi:3-phenylpropionate/trans-cinnamate dioxygenase ferredoxin component
MSSWVRLASPAEAPASGEMRAFPLDRDTVVVLARLAEGDLVAFDDMCTHEECPLSDGELEGGKVVCYCHSGEFDVLTGAVVKGPPEDSIPVFPIRAVDGELQVQLLSTLE